MKRKLIPTLLLAASLLFTACATPAANTATTTAKETTPTTTETTKSDSNATITAKEFEDFKTQKESEITALKQELDTLKKDIGKTPDISASSFDERPAGLLYFPLITLNADDMSSPYTAGYVAIEPQASIREKLEKLTAGISKLLFNGNKIEVTDIKKEVTDVNIEGKEIVYINLVNAADWEPKFQGSTGGAINSESLILSYLQKGYKDSWIEGVHFTMDSKEIELDHAPQLGMTTFRDLTD